VKRFDVIVVGLGAWSWRAIAQVNAWSVTLINQD
jgi:hypothetical protein